MLNYINYISVISFTSCTNGTGSERKKQTNTFMRLKPLRYHKYDFKLMSPGFMTFVNLIKPKLVECRAE